MDEKYITYIMYAIFGDNKKDKIVFSDNISKLINELQNILVKSRIIIDKSANGMNMCEIARHHEVSPSTIRYQIIKAIR